ncbi:zn 2cys6 transcription factor [Seiridium cupressi]
MSYASGRPHPNTILTPTSLDSAHNAYGSPAPVVVKSEWADSGQSNRATPEDAGGPAKKQKRNKPTLSCHECVERKTKHAHNSEYRKEAVVTNIPVTECKYAQVADLLEQTTRSATNGTRMTKPPKRKLSAGAKDLSSPVPNAADRGISAGPMSRGTVASSTGLLSNIPYSLPTASKVFGVGAEHPFANYWTYEGKLEQVISVMPKEKANADMLIAQYFECVDPVYPMIHRQTFYADYEHFWSLLHRDQQESADPAFVGLIFVMMALGTQFQNVTSPEDGKRSAEFYASASNQALRIGCYLSSASIQSIQAMVLLTYFLINDNHASDGWSFAGILMRQAYAMGLHRDPNIVVPNASKFEKQQRRKLWQAVLHQDTFLTILLSLPPSATHTDVNVDDLVDDPNDIVSTDPRDTAYIRGSWSLANLVQETICSPRSLDMPICSTQRQKSKLISDFRAVYRSFPDVFRSWDHESLTQLATTNQRIVRQTLFLTSNYYHNLMLVHASESADVPVNVRATLEAAHEAINAFFMMYNLFDHEARVWWVFNHRAFLEALCIGTVLRESSGDVEPEELEKFERDPLFARARADLTRMMQIMQLMGEGDQGSEVARTRVTVLSEFL